MKTTHKIYKSFSITDSDYQIIKDAISFHDGDKSLHFIILYIKKIFGENFTDGHYLAAGYIIGVNAATEEHAATISNITRLCQRQN